MSKRHPAPNSEDLLKDKIKRDHYDYIWGELNILMIGVGAVSSLIGTIYILIIDFNRPLFIVNALFFLSLVISVVLWRCKAISRARLSLIMATYTYFILTPAIWHLGGVFSESAPYFAIMITLINGVMLSGPLQGIYLSLYILIVSAFSIHAVLTGGATGLVQQALVIRLSAFILTLLVVASIALYILKHFDGIFNRNINFWIKDNLTGMLDRRVFEIAIAIVESRYIALEENYLFVMLDIDRFKGLNDRYGHIAGDMVLRGTAECIMANIRGTDFAFRYGGDEILLVLPQLTAEKAGVIIDRIETKARKQIKFDFDLAFSHGCAARSECTDPQEMLVLADRRMYGKKVGLQGPGDQG